MRYRIHQIKLNIDQTHDDLERAVKKQLKRKSLQIYDLRIVRESIDARKKPDIKLVYTLDFSCDEELPLQEAPNHAYMPPECMTNVLENERNMGRPVVVGFGPCGIFAGLILAKAGLRPLIIERGASVEKRVQDVERFWNSGRNPSERSGKMTQEISSAAMSQLKKNGSDHELDPESNVQFGEGGAGTFSDGKLTTGIKDPRIQWVLQQFAEAGADPDILYKQKPHIGTDKLRQVVKNLRKTIEQLGGEIRFNTRLEELTVKQEDGREKLDSIVIQNGSERQQIRVSNMILAIGHSARDTFEMLLRQGMEMEQKPFSIGVRIEHPQELIDKAQYGNASLAKILGPADYKLNHRCENGRGVYTFCMCPGGMVINAASEPETAVTNGMSNRGRDTGTANSGLLVDVYPQDFASEHPLAGVEFQRKYEHMAYLQGNGWLPRTTYQMFRSEEQDPVRSSLPDFAVESILEAMPKLGRKLRGFDRDDAVMTAVETRSSSPVRIFRNEHCESSIAGIYPAGEGPGYAGGIMSAAVDGIKTAEQVIRQMERRTQEEL